MRPAEGNRRFSQRAKDELTVEADNTRKVVLLFQLRLRNSLSGLYRRLGQTLGRDWMVVGSLSLLEKDREE